MDADRKAGKVPGRRNFTAEFKRDSVNLVVEQGYTFKAAAEAVGVSSRSLREWHEKTTSAAVNVRSLVM